MIVLREMTKAQFLARLRADYAGSTGERATRLATLVLDCIASGFCTDAEMRSAFGKTVAQWAPFKSTVLTPQANARAAVRGARGE